MALNAQITRTERHVARHTGVSHSKLSPVCVTHRTRTSKALVARAQPQGNGDVCDPPAAYNQGAAPEKVVRYVHGEDGEREFEAPTVVTTVVQHEVERVKPVIHKEVHQTRLHEVTHHKTESPRDRGIIEVVEHGDTDPCGNRVVGDMNAVRGTGTTTADTTAGYGTASETQGVTERPITEGIRGAINELLPGEGPFKEKV